MHPLPPRPARFHPLAPSLFPPPPMTIRPAPSVAAPPSRDAQSPEEAARQFESVLVRQFVEVMTKDLFQGGEDGMLTGQADLQRDTLTDTLAEHLVESGTFGIADLLMKQWAQQGRVPSAAPTASAPPADPTARAGRGGGEAAPAASRALSMDDALRLYPPAKARPLSIDHSPSPSPDTAP